MTSILTYAPTIDTLCERVTSYNHAADIALIRRAYAFADAAHAGQKRATGEPYIIHPLTTASTLAEMRLPTAIIVAGLLHDVPEDTARTLEDIKAAFGEDVASMVAGITKLGNIKYRGMGRYIDNLRKLFLAVAAAVRVIHRIGSDAGVPTPAIAACTLSVSQQRTE